ncbi:MAG: HAMP domain-containing sensor histidine kinase, partial [Syntrophaceae bacterium]|nr:HAMP domain-containing sensor histidine kinase [Syntrophaceae bacterium]
IELVSQVIMLRDVTDQFLISKEVGRLYRYELGGALDIMGIGLQTAKQMLNNGKLEEGVKFIDQVEDKRIQLLSMLEERIDFIRLHSDSFRITPSLVNLNLLVGKCVSNYKQIADEKNVLITSNHLKATAISVRAEERFLMKLFDNLIRNAIKFSNDPGTIRISLGSKRNEAFVKIEDKGVGIPEKNLNRIFRLGFTTGGSGRGLYMARKIALAHSGRIDVKSKTGQGSCFTVILPLPKENLQ